MDDNNKPNLQAVIEPAEVWHLGQGSAFEMAARVVMEAKEESAAGSLDGFCERVLDKLTGLKNGSFDTWFRTSERPMTGPSRVPSVRFDDSRNLPMIELPQSAPTNSWGMIDIEGNDMEPGMVLAAPFRETSVERLRIGTMVVKLQDPHHAATAALVEILKCARRDAESAFLSADGRIAWRRLNTIISVYRNAARVGLDALGDDDFINWKPDMPARFEIGSAAGLICQIAATSRAQCTMAINLMATWLQVVADSTESRPHPERQREFFRRLNDATEGVEKALDGMNLALARSHWHEERPYDCMVIMRPVPQSIPVLAIIPKLPEENVSDIRGSKKGR